MYDHSHPRRHHHDHNSMEVDIPQAEDEDNPLSQKFSHQIKAIAVRDDGGLDVACGRILHRYGMHSAKATAAIADQDTDDDMCDDDEEESDDEF